MFCAEKKGIEMIKIEKRQHKVVVKFNGVPDEEGVKQYLSDLKDVYLNKEKMIILYDARKLGSIPFTTALRQAKMMHSIESHIGQYVVRTAIVIPNNTVRGVLNMLLNLRPPVSPSKVFLDIEEARNYLREVKMD
jgi:hypothetical protein